MRALAVGILGLFLVVALAGACGGSKPEAAGPQIDGLVIVLIVPKPDTLPFDPRGARLRAASAELGKIAGHPVTFVIDAALAEESRSGFESQLIGAIETVARDLAALKEDDPTTFSYGVPLLDKITCKYRALANKLEPSFDEGARTLQIVEPADHWELVPRRLVRQVLFDSYEAHAAARYAAMSPRDVPPGERRAYFRYVTDARGGGADDGPLRDREATSIVKLVELAAVNGPSDSSLAAELHTWLLRQMSFFVQAYVHHGDAAQGPAPAFHAAERAWVGWLQRELPRMSAADRLTVAKSLFVRGFNGRGYLPFAFPGFDKMGFALGVVDGWIAAGHPDTFANTTPENALFEYIVCPHPVNERGDRSMGPRCEHEMYGLAIADPAADKRLVDAIVAKNDPRFTEYAFVAMRYASGGDAYGRVSDLWQKVEAHEPSWRIGARVMAEELAYTSDHARLVSDVRRLWSSYPARRGPLLNVLAEADPSDNASIDWKGFAHDYGALVQPAEFAAFLEQSPRAVSRVATIWPALGHGWARAPSIVPHLDAWLASPQRKWDGHAVYEAFRRMFNRMCAENGASDLAQIRAYLTHRAKTDPGDDITSLADEAVCAGRPASAKHTPRGHL